MLEGVDRIILVLSGKGGVGKSTVSSGLAVSLALNGYKVGLLDVDICGPSVPTLFGLKNETVSQNDKGWLPVRYNIPGHEDVSLSLMSIGFLLNNPNDAVIWRGPKKNAMIRQFLDNVLWGDLDFLVVDTPPGTSDEHMSLIEYLRAVPPKIASREIGVDNTSNGSDDDLNNDDGDGKQKEKEKEKKNLNPLERGGAVLVTTPQKISLADVRREATFCGKVKVSILGVVENMSGYSCPHCDHCTHVFSKGAGKELARENDTPMLAEIPIDPRVAAAMDGGTPFVSAVAESATAVAFNKVVSGVEAALVAKN